MTMHHVATDPALMPTGVVPAHDFRASIKKAVDLFQLRDADRRLQISKTVIEPTLFVIIAPLRAHRMITQASRALIEFAIISGQHTAFTGRDNLVSIKTEDTAFGEATYPASPIFSTMRFSGILKISGEPDPRYGPDRYMPAGKVAT